MLQGFSSSSEIADFDNFPIVLYGGSLGFPGGSVGKVSTCNAGDLGSILCWEDPLDKGMTTHFSILAWEIPWTEVPGGLQCMGLQSAGPD